MGTPKGKVKRIKGREKERAPKVIGNHLARKIKRKRPKRRRKIKRTKPKDLRIKEKPIRKTREKEIGQTEKENKRKTKIRRTPRRERTPKGKVKRIKGREKERVPKVIGNQRGKTKIKKERSKKVKTK